MHRAGHISREQLYFTGQVDNVKLSNRVVPSFTTIWKLSTRAEVLSYSTKLD